MTHLVQATQPRPREHTPYVPRCCVRSLPASGSHAHHPVEICMIVMMMHDDDDSDDDDDHKYEDDDVSDTVYSVDEEDCSKR